MVTDLVQIRQKGAAEDADNLRFRRFLSQHHYREDLFHRIARHIEEQIDCQACANCCRETRVAVSSAEIDALAAYLNQPRDQVVREYLEPDRPGGETLLRHNADGCVFLDGNLCLIYRARPRACREFPYLTGGARSLGGRMSSVCRHANLCPIIYNTLAEYKHAVGYHG